MNTKSSEVKGFTLIELLVVIAIVAILSVVVILSLNPAELLKQARDSNRISDMSTLKSAISLYLADVSVPAIASSTAGNGGGNTCYTSLTANQTSTLACQSWFPTINGVSALRPSRAIDGSGWIPINFNLISSGAPVGQLPVDPVNNPTYFYSYTASNTNLTFKLVARVESIKYNASGSSDIVSTDGDVATNTANLAPNITYSAGTNLSL